MNGTDENCNGSYNEGCSSQLLDCGGPGALQPGVTVACNFSTRVVTGIRIRSGCNDGESGNYTITFSDGTSVNFSAGCGTTYNISDKVTSSATLYMNSGGGGDNNIHGHAVGPLDTMCTIDKKVLLFRIMCMNDDINSGCSLESLPQGNLVTMLLVGMSSSVLLTV